MIYPRCRADMHQVYVTAEGDMAPCCWIGCEPHMSRYKKFHEKYFEDFSLKHRSVDEILADPRYQKIEASWQSETPYPTCKEFCSQPLPEFENKVQGKNAVQALNLNSER